ncbi:hypothetical protein FKM82_004400 [Ascaphus truei]
MVPTGTNTGRGIKGVIIKGFLVLQWQKCYMEKCSHFIVAALMYIAVQLLLCSSPIGSVCPRLWLYAVVPKCSQALTDRIEVLVPEKSLPVASKRILTAVSMSPHHAMLCIPWGPPHAMLLFCSVGTLHAMHSMRRGPSSPCIACGGDPPRRCIAFLRGPPRHASCGGDPPRHALHAAGHPPPPRHALHAAGSSSPA